jgi:hypothetical protein
MKTEQPKTVFAANSKAYMKGEKPPMSKSKPRGCGAAKRGCTPVKS